MFGLRRPARRGLFFGVNRFRFRSSRAKSRDVSHLRSTRTVLLTAILFLASCHSASNRQQFPKPNRSVSPIVDTAYSTEEARDRLGEFTRVIGFSGVKPGMWVADIGSGEGYYAVRLSPVVGRRGRVLAEDIRPDVIQALANRVQKDNLDNVAVKLGAPDDPKLPPHSFDRIFLAHVYHEVESPYAFLWHLRDGLKPGATIDVVELDRPPERHGLPPGTLECEFAAVGLKQVKFEPMPDEGGYFAAFVAAAPKPAPSQIKPCKG